ncbi:Alpha-1,4-glucan:maltose-1-phosphate maltosyltransferase 2 [Frankia canadensis]|uniref:Alpha-1,4-glucan:maltose-1-phosphate maltosyltransferase n=1 Tax=Frankia canadensis TaxID=1836972 RepID=A0A2I2KK14_9ACTN|nr:alpha-1,4-glucan--maltose-1-phosphate maltosyltransferase [Frankia canadensis]SNQ46003.1 Alpha-1,4-glucan:maltose-1-phosphate maltosyltransferase 2 [Frankia canadensis]SOU53293.1 Alpha-1,4-glucan:maltose-1-phosphate maltosyltransferase 2 [Frankia canadensis]
MMIGRSVGRVVISDVTPVVSCGQWPTRAVVGENFTVSATVFREGHDLIGANAVLSGPDGRGTPFVRMRSAGPGTDRYEAEITAGDTGLWGFRVEAWADPVATWQHGIELKVGAGQTVDELAVDFEDGARLLLRALPGVPEGRRAEIARAVATLRDDGIEDPAARIVAALDPRLTSLLAAFPLRDLITRSPLYRMWVDRPRALFGSWYEMFPRSEGATLDPPRSGTFLTAAERLPAIADMGFDVVYLPPIHPVGEINRKGPNNTLTPGPDDPGSPWAIGSEHGGHDAVHPDLGTIDDFDLFVARARSLGMEVALDLALQCAPDHPWAKRHPEWFVVRSDGSIAYAENPPKKYQDIYPLNFDADPTGLYQEILRVVRHWTAHGVRIFRVDNPHTKPVEFWEWLIGQVKATEPDVLFLAEAFTRPAMMHTLARVGFTQSYTYFTWRNTKWELEEYAGELVAAGHYMRPNFFVNTPDILPGYLVDGGEPAFRIRALLAATLSPTWGVYAGYELYERTPVRPGSEEYLDSEKYQYRPRDWAGAERAGRSLAPYLTRLNQIRRAHPALQWLRNLHLHHADSDQIMVYSKRLAPADVAGAGKAPGGAATAPVATAGGARVGDAVLVIVNLDPHQAHETTVRLDLPALGLDWSDALEVTDEITGATYRWGQDNYVRLDPAVEPAHVFTVRAVS